MFAQEDQLVHDLSREYIEVGSASDDALKEA